MRASSTSKGSSGEGLPESRSDMVVGRAGDRLRALREDGLVQRIYVLLAVLWKRFGQPA